MLMLFCVQVLQINNNESCWREKKKQLSSANKKKNMQTCQENKKILIEGHKGLFFKVFFLCVYSHNLGGVYMECDYTHLNHNLLLSPKKKVVTRGVIIKGVYCIQITTLICQLCPHLFQLWWVVWFYKSKCWKSKLILFKSCTTFKV
jgi:hypothetical protein